MLFPVLVSLKEEQFLFICFCVCQEFCFGYVVFEMPIRHPDCQIGKEAFWSLGDRKGWVTSLGTTGRNCIWSEQESHPRALGHLLENL